MRFVDTNILLYAVGAEDGDSEKRRLSLDLLTATDLALSVQVLQEFYFQATRPSRPDALRHDEAVAFVHSLQRFPVQAITPGVMHSAFRICVRFRLSYWDSAILAAARACNCDTVYSEDMNHGQDYGGVRVENPFAGTILFGRPSPG